MSDGIQEPRMRGFLDHCQLSPLFLDRLTAFHATVSMSVVTGSSILFWVSFA